MVKEKLNSKNKHRAQSLVQLLLILAIVILLNIVSSFMFHRFDLTAEKRFTLTPVTKNILEEMKDVAYIKVYLDGDLPVGFKRLQNSIKEILDEFRVYGNTNIEYEFINPAESSDKKTRTDIFRQLYNKGLNPTNLEDKDSEGATKQKVIFPGAIVTFRNEEVPVNFLKNNPSLTPEQNLNNSSQDLEYLLIDAIKKASAGEKKKIAFVEGHGELSKEETEDAALTLYDYYTVKRVRLNGQLRSLQGFDAVIIARPDSGFNEADKYIIDQFVMNGGKVLWLIDYIKAEMDSLANSNNTMAMIQDLGLHDQLFKYGVRLNPDVVQDLQCAQIPVNTAIAGAAPKFTPVPWPYFPVIISQSGHPVTKNLDLLKLEFPCTIDTVGEDKSIKKTILLTTSKYSKSFNAPARVSLDILRSKPDVRQFTSQNLPVAVLLEGSFTSIYKNRIPPEMVESKEIGFKEKSVPTKMIVVSDGDVVRNIVKVTGGKKYPLPLGTDKWFPKVFYGGNKQFLLNAMNYMLDDKGMMVLRAREIELRLLDKARVNESKLFWQVVTILVPVIIIAAMGFAISRLRKRSYSRTL